MRTPTSLSALLMGVAFATTASAQGPASEPAPAADTAKPILVINEKAKIWCRGEKQGTNTVVVTKGDLVPGEKTPSFKNGHHVVTLTVRSGLDDAGIKSYLKAMCAGAPQQAEVTAIDPNSPAAIF